MKRSDLIKLSLAVAAAAVVGTQVTPGVAYDVTPARLIELVQERVQEGDLDAVDAYIDRLRAMGVIRIVVGRTDFSLDEFKILLTDKSPQSRAAVVQLLEAARQGEVSFVVGGTKVSSVQTDDVDAFPVGSAG